MGVSRVLGALTATQRCFGTVIRANEDQVLHLKAAFRKLHLVSFGAIRSRSELQVLAQASQTSGLQMKTLLLLRIHDKNKVDGWVDGWLGEWVVSLVELVAWMFGADAGSECVSKLQQSQNP